MGNRTGVKADTVPLRTLRALRLIKNRTAEDAKSAEVLAVSASSDI